MARLVSDCDNNQTKRIFEILASDTRVFEGCSNTDMEDLINVLKVVSYKKGETICKQNEFIDFFAIVLYGTLRIGNVAELSPL